MVYSLAVRRAIGASRSISQQINRCLSTSAIARKDIVQDAYLRELHAYKAPAKAADAHKGQVRDFSAPKQPEAPKTPSSSDLSSELEAFAKAEPDHADHSASSTESGPAAPREDVNAFLEEARKPYEVEAHH